MKIYITDQANRFGTLLADLVARPAMPFDKRSLKEKVTTINIETDKSLGQINLDFLFDYKIFPPNIMTYMTQWGMEKRKMQIRDTILQQALIPPTRYLSQKIIFGVRINQIINERDRRGFGY